MSFLIYSFLAFTIRLLWCRVLGGAALWLGDSVGSYIYRGVVLLYSPRDNLHSVPAFGYNSTQRPVIVVSTSIYCFYLTAFVCFTDPPSLPCDMKCRNLQLIPRVVTKHYS